MALAARRRRGAILREMGLGPLWRLRTAGGTEASVEDSPAEPAGPPDEAAADAVLAARPVAGVADGAPAPASSPGRLPTSAIMGTDGRTGGAIRRAPLASPSGAGREVGAVAAAAAPASPGPTAPTHPLDPARAARIATLDWEALEQDIRGCRACVLCERRRQAVPGVGDRAARWMLVGEGPGAEEDQRGEPFVGQAGRLLDNMLAAIGLKRGEDVYIANAVKCRPPHNRTPERVELESCLPYLERQIALVQPKLLLALGRPAAQALLDRDLSISAARGKVFEHGGVAVVVSYHPAYLLRNPQDKGKAWEDLCFARRLMAQRETGGG